ncbi:unnamed protein product, partial [Closterium sp. NIES-53]
PDPGIGTAALGAGEASALGASASVLSGAGEAALSGTSASSLSGTASASASHTFTLDSGASRSFFRDRTTLTPLSRPVAVSLADSSGGPVLSRFSTVLPCPAAPSGTLSGLYLPSFSTNLVSGADLQDAGVHQFTPARQRVTHCTEASTGRHLATFTRQPGSSLYTLTTASPLVPESGRVPSSGQVFAAASRSGPESAPCSCRRLSHETLLWHHRLGHTSLLRLRGMASRLLVSGLPRSLPPLPQGPGPTCVPCVEGRQRAAPHSSQFPPTEAPLQTLHMDVWGPARVRGLGHERYFLLVVDDYSRYTTVFPLRSKGDVTEVLIDWIRAARLQLRQSFGSDFPVLRLHSDRGGEFSSGLLRAFCRARGIRQTFTLPDSPQQNGIVERRIGMVMDVARTSMMHAAAPHFLWPFVVRYAAHQINLHPRVSRPETSPGLLWTGKVGDASAFRVWGSRAFVRDLSADKLSPRAAPCVFLGFRTSGTPPPTRLRGAWPGVCRCLLPPVGVRSICMLAAGTGTVTPRDVRLCFALLDWSCDPLFSPTLPMGAPLDEVVMDVVGPLKLGAAGAEYFLTIVDVYTRMAWVYVLSKKSDVAETVKTDWLPMVERQQDRLVKAIRTDRGGEFLSKEFSLWLKKNGIRHSLTMPYSPAMNGIAERANRTITETACELLIEAGLPDNFWPDAVRSACVAKNRALNHVGVDKWVPYVEWIGRKPKVDMLRVFGCMCMALVPKHLRHNKLGAKAIWADCKFMENLMYKDWKAENEAKIGMRLGDVKSSGLEHVELPLEMSSGSTTTRQSSLVNGGEEAKDAEEEEEEVQQVSERAPTLPSRTTSAPRIRVTPQQRQGLHVLVAEEEGKGKRRIQAPNRLTYEALGKPAKSALAGAALIVGDDEETTLKEALESSDAEEWKKAMESELKSIEENGTWELVELPEGRKAITSKWLFKIKSDADGKIERYKSRLPTTLRTLLAGAAIKGWVVKQMDVTTTFLNGVLEEEIFMAQPEEFEDGSGRVLRLKKALYGLKQAPRQWYLKLLGVLEEIGFTPSTADHSLFMLGEGEQRSFMVVYVGDILIFSPSSDLVKEVMLKLQDKFKCKALGDVNFYLGLHIERDVEKRCMRVHQRKYLEALAANFGQSEGHVATPFPSGFKCVKGSEEESVGEEERRRFHSLVGSLMYPNHTTGRRVCYRTVG